MTVCFYWYDGLHGAKRLLERRTRPAYDFESYVEQWRELFWQRVLP